MESTSTQNNVGLQEAISYYAQKEYALAIKELHSIKLAEGESTKIFYYLGLCYTNLYSYRDALLCLQQVLDAGDGFIYEYQCRMISGYVYSQIGQFKESANEFQELLDRGYDSAKIRSALAYALFQDKSIDRSIEEIKKALDMDPVNANALNTLGYIYASENIDNELAMQYCRMALKQEPNNPAYLDSLATVLINNKELEQARALLERASALSKKSNRDIEQRLRNVYEMLKR